MPPSLSPPTPATGRAGDPTPAAQVSPVRLHAAFVAAFADYVAGPFNLAFEAWPSLLARQAVSVDESRVVLDAVGEVQAFALVAVRRDAPRWRLATMGALPAARGSGAARGLLADLIQRATAAGQSALELEVFAQNPRALALYRREGFEPRHTLHGYRWVAEAAVAPSPTAAIQEVDRSAALAWLERATAAVAELPLQVTAAVLMALTQDWQAWQCGTAQLVFSQASADAPVVLHSLVDTTRGQADAERLLRSLQSKYAAAVINVPQLQRDDVGGEALRRCGFAPLPLHQLWMHRALTP